MNNRKLFFVSIVFFIVFVEHWFGLVNSATSWGRYEKYRVNCGSRANFSSFLVANRNPIFGFMYPPDSIIQHSQWIEGHKWFENVYFTDQYSRRITPVKKEIEKNKFAIFFGCSYVFGWGLGEKETLPFYFTNYAKEYMPYNYAGNAYGPQNMLAILQKRPVKAEIPEKEGIVVYVYMYDHINRLTGALNVSLRGFNSLPYYFIDSNDKLVNKGLHSQRAIVKYIYNWLGKSQTIRYFFTAPSTNAHHTDKEIELFARVMAESRDICKKNLGTGKFYVVFVNDPEPEIKARLDKYGVMSLHENIQAPTYPDGHPRAEYNNQLARAIAKDIGVYNDGK